MFRRQFSIRTNRKIYMYTVVQKNRVHFKNQASKFSSILYFVNVDFDIIFVNVNKLSVRLSLFYVFVIKKM
jgi:hypothetical protein